MLNPAKLLEVIDLADTLVAKESPTWTQIRINDSEGIMQAMAYPNKDNEGVLEDYEVEAYPVGGDVGILNWENMAQAKLYCAAKMLGYWDELAELHPSNRKDS